MKILSIGNSFSQDAQYYLHDLSVSEGASMECTNLYIGGCPLKRHWENVCSDEAAYTMEKNGAAVPDHPPVSVRGILESGDWDIITLQQASHDSGQFETYQPYLSELAGYIRTAAPQARLMLQETWAYETDSDHPEFPRYQRSQAVMYSALRDAYLRAGAAVQAPLIPVGDVIQALRALPEFDYPHGAPSLCRDGFHLSMTLGRYAAAAVWFMSMQKKPVSGSWIPEAFGAEEKKLVPVILETAEKIVFGGIR